MTGPESMLWPLAVVILGFLAWDAHRRLLQLKNSAFEADLAELKLWRSQATERIRDNADYARKIDAALEILGKQMHGEMQKLMGKQSMTAMPEGVRPFR